LDGGAAGIFVWVGKVRFLKKKGASLFIPARPTDPRLFLELLIKLRLFVSVLLVLRDLYHTALNHISAQAQAG
jgi:hypothetical protein